MMKRFYRYFVIGMLLFLCTGCSGKEKPEAVKETEKPEATSEAVKPETETSSQYFAYEIDEKEKTATIISYLNEEEESIVVPEYFEYEGEKYPVTNIEKEAFYYNLGLKHITIPDTVKTIGKEAFCKCDALVEIEIPGTVQSMGTGLFYDCTSLEKVTFGEGIKNLPDEIFTNCESLAEITLPSTLVSIGKEVFWSCTALKTLDIPENVVMIGDRSFYISGIKELTIRSDAFNVDEDMFEGMDELEKLYVPEHLKESFAECVDQEVSILAVEE